MQPWSGVLFRLLLLLAFCALGVWHYFFLADALRPSMVLLTPVLTVVPLALFHPSYLSANSGAARNWFISFLITLLLVFYAASSKGNPSSFTIRALLLSVFLFAWLVTSPGLRDFLPRWRSSFKAAAYLSGALIVGAIAMLGRVALIHRGDVHFQDFRLSIGVAMLAVFLLAILRTLLPKEREKLFPT